MDDSKETPKPSKSRRHVVASDLLGKWRDDLITGEAPPRFRVGGDEFDHVEIGPGQVLLLGGAPGAGKTALTMQWVCDALRLDESLRVLVCNVEMTPQTLLDRQLSRLAGVDLTAIRTRNFDHEQAEKLEAGFAILESFADRLAFVEVPFDLGTIADAADEFDAGLLVLDYIQRIAVPAKDEDGPSSRSNVNASMNYLRQFAAAGLGVVVLSAVGRTKDARCQSSYAAAGLNLASFRESSELEFGADAAFILCPAEDDTPGLVTLKHLKNRHGDCLDVDLNFCKPFQMFEATGFEQGEQTSPSIKKSKRVAKNSFDPFAAWESTPAADDEGAGE